MVAYRGSRNYHRRHGASGGRPVIVARGGSYSGGPDWLSDPFYFVLRHTMFVVAGIGVFFGVSALPEIWIRRLAVFVFLVSFLLLASLLVIGHETKGAQRWLRIGSFSLQPSEFVKPALVVVAAWFLSQRETDKAIPWTLITLALFAPTIGLLLLQPDVGQTVLLTSAFLVVFFVSGMSVYWIGGFALFGTATAAFLYFQFEHVRYRIHSFLDASSASYQLEKAHEAIARGGIAGVGPGEGRVKYSLPDPHTDFIYSVAGEEFGYLVCLGLMIIFLVICLRGMLAAARRADPFVRSAGTALFFLFGAQAAINIGVNVGLLPTKGMTLPLISYGGSSLLGTALTLGFGLALTRKRAEFHPGIR